MVDLHCERCGIFVATMDDAHAARAPTGIICFSCNHPAWTGSPATPPAPGHRHAPARRRRPRAAEVPPG